MGVKIMIIQIETFPGLGNIARWGPLPISLVLRSEGSLKSEMLSLARTSKYIHFNQHRASKHLVIILGLPVVTICWSCAWTICTSPYNGVGLGRPLASCSVYGDLTCSVHTVNNLCLFNCQWHVYLCNWKPCVRLAYMPNMLSSWNKVIIMIMFALRLVQPTK